MEIEEIYKFHDYFCKKCNNRFTSNTFTDREQKVIVNFKEKIEKTNGILGYDYLFSFLTFQFQYWGELDTQFGKSNTVSGWIYGKKAIDRWDKKHDTYLFWLQQYQNKMNLYLTDLVKVEINREGAELVENLERERFHNTDHGLLNCVSFTSMYQENNAFCKICVHTKECKEVKECN